MADNVRDRLLRNLEEVDKSLRRSYIVQIIVCFLYLYLFYNAILVEDRIKIIDTQLSDARCTLGEFEESEEFIKLIGEERQSEFKAFASNIDRLAGRLKSQPLLMDDAYGSISKASIYNYSAVLTRAVEISETAVSKNYQVNIDELILLVRVLLSPDLFIEKEAKYYQKSKQEELDSLGQELNKHLGNIRELLKDSDFTNYVCASMDFSDDSSSLRPLFFNYRVSTLEKTRYHLNLKGEIYKGDITSFTNRLSKELEGIKNQDKGNIKIPVVGQSLDNRLAFRIGPFVILLLQFLICIYFRHRNDLILKIKSSFDAMDRDSLGVGDDIHLLLWPWVLNFPYFTADKDRVEKQKGAVIIEIFLQIFQFLPVITIGVISFRLFYFGTTESPGTVGRTFADMLFIVISAGLLLVTFFQVQYSRKLNRQINITLGWRKDKTEKLLTRQKPTTIMLGEAFKRLERSDYILIIAGSLIGMTSQFQISFDLVHIDLRLLQIMISFIIGHRYGRRIGLISGLLIFLPNFILYYFNIYEDVDKYFFFAFIYTEIFRIKAFGIVSYLLYGSLGYLVAVFKKHMTSIEHPITFFDQKVKMKSQKVYLIIIAIIIYSFSFVLSDTVRINPNFIVPLILVFIAFFYGHKKTLFLTLCVLPIFIINLNFGPFGFGLRFSPFMFFWVFCIPLFASYLNIIVPHDERKYSKVTYAVLLLIGSLLSFRYSIADNIDLYGYPFAVSIVLFSGYLFGPRKGFYFGLLLGILSNIYRIQISSELYLLSPSFLFNLVAPILGYLGGCKLFSNKGFLRNGIYLALVFYGLLIFYTLLGGSNFVVSYIYPIVLFIQTLISLVFLYFVSRIFIKDDRMQDKTSVYKSDGVPVIKSRILFIAIFPGVLVMAGFFIAFIIISILSEM